MGGKANSKHTGHSNNVSSSWSGSLATVATVEDDVDVELDVFAFTALHKK